MAAFGGFVASIDFGTTFCGLAFAPNKEDLSVSDIKVPVDWPFGAKGIETKVPTVILFNSKRQFQSFGFQAIKEYSRLNSLEKQSYYYFERFKMDLHQKESFSKNDMLPSTNNPNDLSLPILKVFSAALCYLKTYAFNALKKVQGKAFRETDVQWVVTVPAIWNAEARQFMREAAREAGILLNNDPRRLTIALEPEGAAIALAKSDGPKFSKYMIIDCGGGTVDICVHEKVDGFSQGETIRELVMPSGGKWGGIYVDNEFKLFLEKVFSANCINSMKRDSLHAWNDIIANFQVAKKDFHTESAVLKDGRITRPKNEPDVCIDAPISFLKAVEKFYDMEIQDVLKKNRMTTLKFEFDLFQISAETMKSFFQPVILRLLQHVEKLITENKVKCLGMKAFYLVGGFAECQLLQNSMKKEFYPRYEVVISSSPKIDIVRGAVLFGISPTIISERISKTTYGIGVTQNFDPEKHNPRYKFKNNEGLEKCQNVFLLMVEKNTPITPLNNKFEKRLTPLHKNQTDVTIQIYTAENPKSVLYTDSPGVKKVGQIKHNWPNPEKGYDRELTVTLNFSGTEILATVQDSESDNYSFTTVDFFSKQY